MEVFHSFEEITDYKGAVVALGTFDGVHLGHQKVMRTAMDKAAETGGKSVVITFAAHPFSVLCPKRNQPVWQQWNKRYAILPKWELTAWFFYL